ncbi:hypothetical protein ACJX0J_034380, partial [Zea mays]
MAASSAPSSAVPAVSTAPVITVASPPTGGGGSISGNGGGGGGSPCAACKLLRRKCQPDCMFAPYFPSDNPQKFVHVHRVFGASNVSKILNDLQPFQRQDAVNSLAYEADMRIRDPVYGCVGVICILQRHLSLVRQELACATYELSKYRQAEAAAASVAVGSHGAAAAAGMAEFVGNAVANCPQTFMDVRHSTAAAAIGGAGGFMQEDNFSMQQMLAMTYEGEGSGAARVDMNGGGGYGFTYSPAAAMGAVEHGAV